MEYLKEGEFYVVYFKDLDTMTFNVTGLFWEDFGIDDRTYALMQQGRRVQICVGATVNDPRGFHPENYLRSAPEGFRFDPNLRPW